MPSGPVSIAVRVKAERPATFLSSAQALRVHSALARRFYELALRSFGASGGPRRTAWPPLTRRYMRRIKYFGPPKLVLKGNLMGSVGYAADAEKGTVWADTPYAAAQEYGRPEINLPARPYFPADRNGNLTPAAASELAEIAEREMAKGL